MANALLLILINSPNGWSKPPNIIFILSDDLGYGDYSISEGVNRSTSIPTPNIQRLADSGMKFRRSYSGPVCAPSRCILMTGRHMGHCTIRGNDGSYTPLLPNDTTVAKVLQPTYTTALFGKWGLGDFGTTGYPLSQGFDFFIGQDSQVACHNWYPHVIQNNTDGKCILSANEAANLGTPCLKQNSKCEWSNDLYKTEAIDFIKAHAKDTRPFFIYLASTTPHVGTLTGVSSSFPVPYPYNTRFTNQSWAENQKQFASAVSAQDDIVGAVLDTLDAHQIAEDTVVFFSGDNGPDSHNFALFDDPGPFRGKKRSLHEGGMRQTIAVQWKGHIKPGSISDHLMVFYDFLPTAADLGNIAYSGGDGVSIVPTLLGHTPQPEHQYLYWEFCCNNKASGLLPQLYDPGWVQALRFDHQNHQWKVIRSNRGTALLFDLAVDESESHDVAKNYSDVVVEAISLMEEAHVEDPYWKSAQNASDKCCNSCFNHNGCPYPCVKRPAPTPAPTPPVDPSILPGIWNATSGAESHTLHFSLSIDQKVRSVTLTNIDSTTSCWQNATGKVSKYSNGTVIEDIVAVGPSCTRYATGHVKANPIVMRYVFDTEYILEKIQNEILSIDWTLHNLDEKTNSWPQWQKIVKTNVE